MTVSSAARSAGPTCATPGWTIDFSSSFYFHNEGEGLLVGMSDREETVGFRLGRDDRWLTGLTAAIERRAPALADVVTQTASLRLRGVMAVAPLGEDPRAAFARLREVRDGIRRSHPAATWMSAGMSGDLEAAVAEGATHLRVGSAILGSRLSHR